MRDNSTVSHAGSYCLGAERREKAAERKRWVIA
jgi:hypothetical protein